MLLVNNAILLFGVFGIVTAKSALRRSKAKSGRAAPYSRSSRTTDKNKKDDVASLADDLESLQVSSLPSAGLEGLLTGFDNFAINSQRGDDDKCYVEWNDEDAGMSIGISARKRPASNSYALDSISYRLNLAEPTPAKQVPAEFTFFLRMRLPGPVQSVAKYYVNLDAFIDTSLDVKHGETCKEQLDGRIRDGFRDDWQLIKKDGQEYYREEYGKYLLASDLLIRFRVSAKEKNFFAQDGNITREVGLAWNPSSRNFKITSLTITSPDPMTLPETPHSLDVLESMMHNFPSNPDYRAAAYRLLFYGETIGEQLGYTSAAVCSLGDIQGGPQIPQVPRKRPAPYNRGATSSRRRTESVDEVERASKNLNTGTKVQPSVMATLEGLMERVNLEDDHCSVTWNGADQHTAETVTVYATIDRNRKFFLDSAKLETESFTEHINSARYFTGLQNFMSSDATKPGDTCETKLKELESVTGSNFNEDGLQHKSDPKHLGVLPLWFTIDKLLLKARRWTFSASVQSGEHISVTLSWKEITAEFIITELAIKSSKKLPSVILRLFNGGRIEGLTKKIPNPDMKSAEVALRQFAKTLPNRYPVEHLTTEQAVVAVHESMSVI